ncbi:hypothetical protein LSUB1_G000491 [Lachnellula subtilissima]|uniref:Uncharacterized protein n=1 Tax=Lachnellula subtilissima TaxID=602034 RepID=A0A8H8S3N5_9HELO|nr:hypothetical protein LSUB1_G000491 [Lachnellula subtilissima]
MNDPRRALPLSSRRSALNSEQYASNSQRILGQSPNDPHTNRDNPFPRGSQPSLSRPVVECRMPSRLDGPESQSQSTLKTSYDVKMATRQLQIESLSSVEKNEQDKWALSQLSLHSTCVMGLEWRKSVNGYRCSGGGHLVTNELLAEGKGGLYHHCGVWLGPMYGQEIIESMHGRLGRRREQDLRESARQKGFNNHNFLFHTRR